MGDMMDNLRKNQEMVEARLKEIRVNGEAGDGAIKVEADGKGEILNISINPDKIDMQDTDNLEDLLLVAVNRAIALAQKSQETEAQKSLNSLIPGGLGGLFG